MKRSAQVSIVGIALMLGIGGSTAQTLRCHGEIVAVGDTRASVLHKCGQPLVKDSFCRSPDAPADRSVGARTKGTPCEDVDEWTYNPGYGQFMTTVRLHAGRVSAIVYGERVK